MGKHQLDYNGSAFARGKESFWQFVYAARKLGYKVTKSNLHEDTKLHFDCRVFVDGKENLIEVKGRKKAESGKNAPLQDEWVVIELRASSGEERSGWLYGQAEYLAFELEHSFIIFPREALAKAVEQMVDFSESVDNFGACTYKVYGRRANCNLPQKWENWSGDQITKVELAKLKEILDYDEWDK